MSTPKQSRRRPGKFTLDPIDWRELAGDAVLNGNMSTLYRRPASEDASAYASEEALQEIRRRSPASQGEVSNNDDGVEIKIKTPGPTVDLEDSYPLNRSPNPARLLDSQPTVGQTTARLLEVHGIDSANIDTRSAPIISPTPTVGPVPTDRKKKVKPIHDVQDALTLAGQVLYKAMYGAPDGAKLKICTKGYRQLAAESHLDKDTVRDLIVDFKEKRMVKEIGTYDPDTRSSKTYEVLSFKAILQTWREAGIRFVTSGRKPQFCDALGIPLLSAPTVGLKPTVGFTTTAAAIVSADDDLAVAAKSFTRLGLDSHVAESHTLGPLIEALNQITTFPVDMEAAQRLYRECIAEASDCTISEVVDIAWSKAALCRSGKIENPIGFLISQVPKHFQGDALVKYREAKAKDEEAVANLERQQEVEQKRLERELTEMDDLYRQRVTYAERFRNENGIDLKSLRGAQDVPGPLREWAERMMKNGFRYARKYS